MHELRNQAVSSQLKSRGGVKSVTQFKSRHGVPIVKKILGQGQQGAKNRHITSQFDNRMSCSRLLAPINCKCHPKVGRLFSIAGEYF